MGPANLKAIETAAKKLERCDPDYAQRMDLNRQRIDRSKRDALNREFEKALRRVVTRGPRFDPDFDTTDIGEQDAALLALAANDNAKPAEKPSSEARVLTYNGESLALRQWSEKTGIPRGTIEARLNAGHSIEKVLSHTYLRNAPRMIRSKRYQANGHSRTICEWSKASGINEGTLRSRIKQGWPLDQAFSVPSGAVMGTGAIERMMKRGSGSELSKKASGPVQVSRATPRLIGDFFDDD